MKRTIDVRKYRIVELFYFCNEIWNIIRRLECRIQEGTEIAFLLLKIMGFIDNFTGPFSFYWVISILLFNKRDSILWIVYVCIQ